MPESNEENEEFIKKFLKDNTTITIKEFKSFFYNLAKNKGFVIFN